MSSWPSSSSSLNENNEKTLTMVSSTPQTQSLPSSHSLSSSSSSSSSVSSTSSLSTATGPASSSSSSPGQRCQRLSRMRKRDRWLLLGASILLPVGIVMSTLSGADGSITLAGSYEATTDITSELNIALDAADIRETEIISEKKDIFENGKNSIYVDEDNNQKKRSISSLSVQAYTTMSQDAMYNVYRHSFRVIGNRYEGETLGQFDDRDDREYGNTIVDDLFDLDAEGIETEAALVMIVWMQVVHHLYEGMRMCDKDEGDKGLADLDRAAAYYVGAQQEKGDNEKGHLLYNLAEKAGERFGQDVNDGVTTTNKNILTRMNSIKTDIIQTNQCSEPNKKGYKAFRNAVHEIIAQMTIPLIQNLIHNMEENKSKFLELYALAISPRIASCDPNAYSYFLDKLVLADFKQKEFGAILTKLQGLYPCLGITCADVGSYRGGQVAACSDAPPNPPKKIAGYTPATDMRQLTYVDREIVLVDILMEMGATDAALEYYTYGRSSQESAVFVHLKDLAINNERSVGGQNTLYGLYTSYYQNDKFYADSLIQDAFSGSGVFKESSLKQRRAAVFRTLQTVITYMTAFKEMYRSIERCNAQNYEESRYAWDKAAAFLIGSIEGAEFGGTEGGVLMYALSREMCVHFKECVGNGNSEQNQELVNFLIQGSLAIKDADGCDDLISLVEDVIRPGMLVSLVQGTLHFALVTEDMESNAPDPEIGAAHVLSRALLPMVDDADKEAANIIDRNLKFQLTDTHVPDGAKAIFITIASVISEMGGNCDDVGVHVDVDFGDLCALEDNGKPKVTPQPIVPGTPTAAPVLPQPTPKPVLPEEKDVLDDGRYTFSTDTGRNFAKIAYDIRDMKASNDAKSAREIYTKGKNLDNISISSLSTNANITMSQDPLYNIYLYAFLDEAVFIEDNAPDDSSYGDTIVHKAFDIAVDTDLAAEAAVVIILYMEVLHQLHVAVTACRNQNQEDSILLAIDKAFAFYVGEDQAFGSSQGHLLYSIAEKVGQPFGQGIGETDVNEEIIEAFVQAKKLAQTCLTDPDVFQKLRLATHEIQETMNVFLVQQLLYFMDQFDEHGGPGDNDDENHVQLYALAVLPQLAGCQPTLWDYFKDKLVDDDLDNKIFPTILRDIGASLNCLGIDCSDLGALEKTPIRTPLTVCDLPDDGDSSAVLAGFELQLDAFEFSKVDRDILQIKIFLQMGAIPAAIDLYTHGRNSFELFSDYRTLQELATTPDRKVDGAIPNNLDSVLNVEFVEFADYYKNDGGENYANKIVVDALNKNGLFSDASPMQITSVVIYTLQAMVSYMATLEHLYTGVFHCYVNDKDKSMLSWSRGAALMLGSIEGKGRGGDPGNSGLFMYGLAKDMCGYFKTCNSASDAKVNDDLLGLLERGQTFLSKDQCDSALETINNDIVPKLQVPLVQGTLKFASDNAVLSKPSDSDTIGSAYALSRAILPEINEFSPSDAAIIDSNLNFETPFVSDGIEKIFQAVTNAISKGVNVNCEDIGTFAKKPFTSVCEKKPENYTKPETPTDISNGLYITTTYVDDRLKIANDVRDMEKALKAGSVGLAKEIYSSGLNSDVFNADGVKSGKRSLKGFSTQATLEMAQEPTFNIVRYSLSDGAGKDALFRTSSVSLYADTIVTASFENPNVKTLAVEAAVALNLWMYVVHELHQTLDRCKSKSLADEDGIHSIDEAVAYWIGDSDQTGESFKGHVLYALAETMGGLFGQKDGGQSRTNRNILKLFNQAKIEMGYPGACVERSDTHPRLRTIVNKIISLMKVPLIQALMYNLEKNDRDRVEVYAHAVVPLVGGCDQNVFKYLKEKLMNVQYKVGDVEEIVQMLQSVYNCLGITCADVGTYALFDLPECKEIDERSSLAGYIPATDVREMAQIDLDIWHINIFMVMGAYDSVKDYYELGQHAIVQSGTSEKIVSLYDLATTFDREIVPNFDKFSRYFAGVVDGDPKNYADTIIRQALDPDFWPLASEEQNEDLVVKALQYMVAYMASLQKMYDAIDDCNSNDPSRNKKASVEWDRAAALLIGSMEGTTNGGGASGMMMYSLAKKRCTQFHTCIPRENELGYDARVNDNLVNLLYAGQAEAKINNCDALKKTSGEIEALLQVPLIQGTLRYALLNQHLGLQPPDKGLAEGYIFSSAVLPYVDEANAEAASTISRNMDFQFNRRPVTDGPGAVFDAFERAIPGMIGVDCVLVGYADGKDVCDGISVQGASSSSQLGRTRDFAISLLVSSLLVSFMLL